MSLFRNVYSLEPVRVSSKFDRRLKTAAIHLGKQYLYLPELLGKHYDYFCLSCPSPTSNDIMLMIRKQNPAIVSILYEDGSGAYNGRILTGTCYLEKRPKGVHCDSIKGRALRSFLKFFGRGRTRYDFSCIYVLKPDSVQVGYEFPVNKLSIESGTFARLNHLFGSASRTIERSDIVVFDSVRLANSMEEGAEESEAIDALLKCLAKSQYDVCLKGHPRSKLSSSYAQEFPLANGLWEMQCLSCDMHSKVLVSVGSTAMTRPVIMSGQEPYLVCLFNAIDYLSASMKEAYELLFRSAQSMYRDKSKVLAPKTIEEANMIIDSLVRDL